jgi:HPt (histidine-containing phosphotransfer) domain-containing protein
MDGHVSRPVNSDELRARVERLVPFPNQRAQWLYRTGGVRLLHDLVEQFVLKAPQRVAKLHEAVLAGDRLAVAAGAHSLGSSLGNLGAEPAQRLAHELEQLAASGSLGGAEGVYAQFRREVGLLMSSIVSFRKRLPQASPSSVDLVPVANPAANKEGA